MTTFEQKAPYPNMDHYCWRITRAGFVEYVVRRPGDGGKDWEWTRDATQKRGVSAYWTRRFKADMRLLGYTHGATPVL